MSSRRLLARALIALGFTALLSQGLRAETVLETSPPGPVAGTTITPVASARVSFADLARQQEAGRALGVPAVRVLMREEDDAESEDIIYPKVGTFTGNSVAPPRMGPTVASPSPTNSFIGLDDIPMADSSYIIIPPDVHGAVGLTKVMDTHNNNYRIQNKATGAVLSTVGTATFWNPVITNKTLLSALTDPHVEYDPINNRWISVMQTIGNTTTTSLVLIAVSQTSDPSGSWFEYAFGNLAGATNLAIDFPSVGFNKNWIDVAINRYNSAGTAFQEGIDVVVSYPAAMAGTLTSGTIFTQSAGSHFCHSPAITYSATEDTLFLVDIITPSTGVFLVDRITGTPTAPVYTVGTNTSRGGPGGWNATNTANRCPQSAPNSGASICGATPCPVEIQDTEVRSEPIYRKDSTTNTGYIYFAQTVGLPITGTPTHTAAQWTKITPSTTPQIIDGGRIEDPTATATNGGKWYDNVHMAVNSLGDMMVAFTQFASNQHPSAGYAYRDHNDASTAGLLSTFRDPVIYKAGEDYYHKTFTTNTGRNRWGDFSKAQVDPSDDKSLWAYQEYGKTRVSTDDGTTGSNGSRWSNYWAQLQLFTITASAGANGTISPSGVLSEPAGSSQTFTITPSSCFSVASLTVDGNAVAPATSYSFTNIQANHTISATFAPTPPFTINASASAGGTIAPSGAVSVSCGGSQTFTTSANSGYYLSDVTVDGVSRGAVASYSFSNVQANHTIAATYTLDTSTIAAQSSSSVICPTNTCVTLPVTLTRHGGTAVLGYSVTFQLSNLQLCAGTSSVTEGTFLSSAGGTTFQVTDNGGGSYTADGAVFTCGPTGSGTLFNVAVGSNVPTGPGSITVTAIKLRDCSNADLPAVAGPPGTVPVDNQAPVVTVSSPNGGETWFIGSTHAITWSATDNVGVANVDIAYSTDGGATFPNTIATAVANSGSFSWLVPNTATTQARVRVTAHDVNCSSASDASDANFTIRTPQIVASAGANGAISPSGIVSVPYGTNQAFTITPNSCYSVADVQVDGGSVGAVTSYTFNNVTADHTIDASFSLNAYTIVASAGAGGSISPSGNVPVNCGANQSFTITPNSCFSIADVVVDGSSVGAVASYTFSNVGANHTITASFSAITYTIVASAGAGGAISPSGNVSVGCGTDQSFTIAPNTCYSISDVVVDGSSVGAVASYTFNNVQANHTITASFTLNTYTIVATAGPHGSITPSGNVTVNCGSDQSFSIEPASSCYQIADVQVDGSSVGAVPSYTFSNVGANHTITASFSLIMYTITATAGPGGSIGPSGSIVVNPLFIAVPAGCGNSQSFAITPDPCYSILDVTVDGNSVGPVASYTFTNISADHTINATFSLNVYTIVASAGANGSISPNGNVSVNCGSDQAFTISPNACYSISDVVVDGVSRGAVASYTFNNVQTNHTIAASFALNTYTIVASAGAGGSISPSGNVSVNCGADQSFSIAPDGCHTLADVVVDGSSVGAVTSYTFNNVQANHTITASFTIITYDIAASAGTGGSIAPSGVVTVNCGSNQSFTITPDGCHTIADVVVDGVSRGAVASYTFASVGANHTIAASFNANAATVGAVTALASSQVKSGNGPSGTTKITITFTPPGGAASVEVWRKGYGSYPTYDNGGGSVPTAPASYPPAGWTLTSVTTSGQTDAPGTRDFWYYVAYARDACGAVGPVSAVTSGTLDYHLGDVSDGVTPGQGDNSVNTADLSLLGSHYGATGATLVGFEYLDVGPTTDNSTNARPTTDGKLDFEDLVMYALNFTPHVSATKAPGMTPATANMIQLGRPNSVGAGEDFDVTVNLSGSGNLQALSVALKWNAAVAKPTGITTGELLAAQGGVMLSPAAGSADAALLGPGQGMTGTGVIATVHFHASAAGDPGVDVDQLQGRDGSNQAVTIAIGTPLAASSLVRATDLQPVIPNPSQGHALVAYALAKDGPVDLSVYSVDGRRVKTLAHGEQSAGQYSVSWNGTDDRGASLGAGIYYVRLQALNVKKTRIVSLVR